MCILLSSWICECSCSVVWLLVLYFVSLGVDEHDVDFTVCVFCLWWFQLTHQMSILGDRIEVANADLKADIELWQRTKHHDVKHILLTLADRHIHCYNTVSEWCVPLQ